MRSIVVLGAGELGGALARRLAAADIASAVVLVDDEGRVAEGKALDILQAAPIDGYATRVIGSRDEAAVIGADVIVIADRAASGAEWQDDGGAALVGRITHLNRSALVLCAGASQMTMVERAVREGGLAARRILGSAPEALRSAVMALTALEAGADGPEVSVAVLGRPDGEVIVPWDEASIGGRRASDVLAPPAIARLERRLEKLWPPGPQALASAAARVLTSAATRSSQALSAFVAVDADGVGGRGPQLPSRERSVRARAAILPIQVSAAGVQAVLMPSLSPRDRVRFSTTLASSALDSARSRSR